MSDPAPCTSHPYHSGIFLDKHGAVEVRYRKSHHMCIRDRLEAVYNPYVDFDGVRALAALEAGRILSWLG